MTKRMLIDASHPEETRVVIVDGSRVEEFDFEAASKRPLKGNIYLAKVTRVEPSLQAAFVEYGGNRQGFLAFSEIHPDYYQIPVADRQALLAEQEAEARRRQEDDIESFEITGARSDDAEEEDEEADDADTGEETAEMAPLVPLDAAPEADADDDSDDETGEDEPEVFVNHGNAAEEEDEPAHSKSQAAHEALGDYHGDHDIAAAEAAEEGEGEIEPVSAPASEADAASAAGDTESAADNAPEESAAPDEDAGEPVFSADTPEAAESEASSGDAAEGENHADAQALQASRPSQKWVRKKHYKIQEVIKRRQIILVQVVKEERGNKGAALTTYLSLAGRYCVLMPNTPRGGGISRKITNAADRKRLKSAAQGLELPEGMGLIIRTAGENRTKLEIRRDYEYLLRLWDTIREKTLSSNAPACVYEEGDLIKRVIRDLYNKDVQDVVVEGEEGYRNAKEFMRMLMPTHAKHVHHYKDTVPLYQRMHIEAQLDSMFSSSVTLKSGGYIVINQTEALVSIDVNSGRATREHSIEETARKTNLEAASEVGRQLRLRDLAGLIVIDFIDMEEGRNDREVEKRLRDAVKNDRARVQLGRISQFGLMEMSRQRLRAGVIAGSTVTCPHCAGAGVVRSVESAALRLLRGLEEEGEKNRAAAVTVKVANDVAIYVLNQKRQELTRIETEHGMEITFVPTEGMAAASFELDRTRQRDPSERPRSHAVSIEAGFVSSDEPEDDVIEEEEEDEDIVAVAEAEEVEEAPAPQPRSESGRRGRRRGGRGQRQDRPAPAPVAREDAVEPQDAGDEDGEEAVVEPNADGTPGQRPRSRRRRRGRRGGRGRGRDGEAGPNGEPQNGEQQNGEHQAAHQAVEHQAVEHQKVEHRQPAVAPARIDRFGDVPDEIDTTPRDHDRHVPGAASTPVWSLKDDIPDTTPQPEPADTEPKPTKKGWWQRTFSGE